MAIDVHLAVRDWDYLTPLLLGEITDPEINLTLTRVNTLVNDFHEHPEFDGGEMSLSRYSQRCAEGEAPVIGIPHFLMRGFRHRCILTRKDSPLKSVEQLAGKRVGLTGWQDSGNTWTRAIFRQQGIAQTDVHWFVGRLTEQHPIVDRLCGFGKPGQIDACPDEKPMLDMLEAGELDAVCTPFMPPNYFSSDSPFRQLIEDYPEQESAYYHQHGYVPGIHILVLKPALLEAHPGIDKKLSELFVKANALWIAKRTKYADTTPWLLDELARTARLLPEDWNAQGMQANQRMLEDWCEELYAQEITSVRLTPQQIFPVSHW